jgi:hypothetical protein
VAHELRARHGEHRAQQRPAHQDNKRQQYIVDLPLDQGRVLVAQKIEDFQEAFEPAGIDDMVGASQ